MVVKNTRKKEAYKKPSNLVILKHYF